MDEKASDSNGATDPPAIDLESIQARKSIIIDLTPLRSVTQRITQLGHVIQAKQENLAAARERIEAGTALTKAMGTISHEFDQFVEILLDEGRQIDSNEVPATAANSRPAASDEPTTAETELLMASKAGDLSALERIFQGLFVVKGWNTGLERLTYLEARSFFDGASG